MSISFTIDNTVGFEVTQTPITFTISSTQVNSGGQLPVPSLANALKYARQNVTGTAYEVVSVPAGTGDVIAPATNTANYLPQWDGTDSKTLKNGIPTSTFEPAKGADDNFVTDAEKILIGTISSKQDALTFGIADTNKVQINAADVADNDYAKFTSSGLEGRSYSEVLSDIGAAATAHTHSIYIAKDGSEDFGGVVGYSGTFTISQDTDIPSKKYVDDAITGSGGYTDEQAQDAVGGMVDTTLTYTDGTPLLKVTNPVTPQTTGFTIAAGTTSKTLTVPDTASVSGTNTGDNATNSQYSGLDAAKISKSIMLAQSIIAAVSANTPFPLEFAEGTVMGRPTGGNVTALSIDIDLSSVSPANDTIPSAKATKALADLKVNLDQTTPQSLVNGNLSVIEPTSASHVATKEYVDKSVSFVNDFYFNNTASSIGGIYYQMLDMPTGEAESTFTKAGLTTGNNQAVYNFATIAGVPGVNKLQAGIYSAHIHAAVTAGNKPTKIYFEIYTRTTGGTETLRATSEISGYVTTKADYDLHATIASDVVIDVTDRIIIKFLANVEATGTDIDLVLYAEGTNSTHLSIPTNTEVLSSVFLRQDATKALTADWTAGAFKITAKQFNSTDLTASELVAADANKNIVSLPVATYPSLTELGYVKGLTSSAQTQITGKIAKTTNITALNETGIADGEIAVFNLTNKDIRTSDKTIVTTLGADDTTVPTSKAVKDVTDALVTKALYDANTIIAANSDNTSAAVTIAEQRIVGRITSGNITALTAAEVLTMLGVSTSSITLPKTLASDHTAEGIKTTQTAAEALAFGDVCYLNSSSKMAKADADAIATAGCLFLAIATINQDADGLFLTIGIARDDSWAWTVGAQLYLATAAGTLTETAPSGADDVDFPIAVARDGDTIFFGLRVGALENVG